MRLIGGRNAKRDGQAARLIAGEFQSGRVAFGNGTADRQAQAEPFDFFTRHGTRKRTELLVGNGRTVVLDLESPESCRCARFGGQRNMNLSLAVGVLSNRRKGVFEAIDHKELKLQGVARNKRFGRKR